MQARADALDALSMLLDSGIPLLQSLEALTSEGGGRDLDPRLRRALVHVREDLRAGRRLAEALRSHPGWFDPAEIALIDAAESGGGGLSPALRNLAERHGSSARLSQKLVGALTYPGVVAAVGIGVALFLALRTLPQLAAVLTAARVEVPGLTVAVMATGQFIARWGWLMLGVAVAACALATWATRAFGARPLSHRRRAGRGASGGRGRQSPDTNETTSSGGRWLPLVVRRIAVARASILVAELLRAGIPLVDALRLTAPAHRGVTAGLGEALRDAAHRIEQGSDVVGALSFRGWFDREYLQLVSVGEASGELAPVLERLGQRYERQAARLIDRLASILEPTAIVVLAVFVGTVVMAAVLPLVKLQEVL